MCSVTSNKRGERIHGNRRQNRVFLATGIVLLVVNAWYLSIVYHSIKGGGLVIAPIRIVGAPAGTSGMDESLARMLLVRLRSITADLEQSQTSLKSDQGSTEAGVGQTGGVSTLFAAPRTVRLEAQLFEPTDFDVKVAGVEVGGLLPWFQRWFVEDRTLSFTVSLQEHTAFVAGNIDALGDSGARPIWIRVENQSPEAIVDGIAFSLIQRAWAEDEREIGDLKPEEFRTLVLSVGRIAEINRRVRTLRIPARAEFAAVLNEVGPLADRIAAWGKLTYFAATIAEGAQDNQRAVALYQRLKEGGSSPVASSVLEAKLKVLGPPGERWRSVAWRIPSASDVRGDAARRIVRLYTDSTANRAIGGRLSQCLLGRHRNSRTAGYRRHPRCCRT